MSVPLPNRTPKPDDKLSRSDEAAAWVVVVLILGASALVAFGFHAFVEQLKLQFQDNPSSFRFLHPQVEQVETV